MTIGLPADHKGSVEGPEHQDCLHRSGGRAPEQNILHHQREEGFRTEGPRRGHGVEEPQGHSGARDRLGLDSIAGKVNGQDANDQSHEGEPRPLPRILEDGHADRRSTRHAPWAYFPAKNWTATGDFAPVEQIGIKALKSGSRQGILLRVPGGLQPIEAGEDRPYAGVLGEGPNSKPSTPSGGNAGVARSTRSSRRTGFPMNWGSTAISAGVTIGFAMELFEKGILTPKDTDGIDLRFGNMMR